MFELASIAFFALIAGYPCGSLAGSPKNESSSKQSKDLETRCNAYCFSTIEPILDYYQTLKDEVASQKELQGFEKLGSDLYYIDHSIELNWTDATDACRKMSAHLTDIKDEKEYNAIRNRLGEHQYWTDITKRGKEYISATTGKKAPFIRWFTGETDNMSDTHCLTINGRSDGRMWDNDCSFTFRYICKRDKNV